MSRNQQGVAGRLWISVAVVCVTVFLVQMPTVRSRAIFLDDPQYVLENLAVSHPSWASVVKFFREVSKPSTVGGYYQPLTMVSLMLDCAQGGSPERLWVFRQTSLLLHVCNVALLALLLYRLFGNAWAAALTSLLFGVHPATVDSVCWLSERKTVLATFFALQALIFYVLYVRRPRKSYLLACSLGYLLGLLSKPTVLPLPLIMLLLAYWPLRRISVRLLLATTPLFALGAFMAGIAFLSQKNAASAQWLPWHAVGYLLLLCDETGFYLRKIIWPVAISSYYYDSIYGPVLSHGRLTVDVVLGGAALAWGLLSLYWTRVFAVAMAIFLGGLLPTLGFVQFTMVPVANKYAYFPMLGILLVVIRCLDSLGRTMASHRRGAGVTRWAIATVLIAVPACEIVATRCYIRQWQDSRSLYGHLLRINPITNPLYLNLGNILADDGDVDRAIACYRRVPTHPMYRARACSNIAGLLYKIPGRRREALQYCQEALRLEPNLPQAYYNLGMIYLSDQEAAKAVPYLQKGLASRLDFLPGRRQLVEALLRAGRPREALDELRRMLADYPAYVPAMKDMAWILSTHPDPNIRMPTEALRVATQATRLTKEQDGEALGVLAAAYAIAGQFEHAVTAARKALARASASNNAQMAEQIRQYLTLYENRQAYVQSLPEPIPPLAARDEPPNP